MDVNGPRVAIPDEAEVVGAAGRRDPAVFHARAQVELEVLPELAHFTPATDAISFLDFGFIITTLFPLGMFSVEDNSYVIIIGIVFTV